MKKIIIITCLFYLIGCTNLSNNHQLKEISMSIIGYSIERLIEQYGAPDFRYTPRCAAEKCVEKWIYGNQAVSVNDNIVVDVRPVE